MKKIIFFSSIALFILLSAPSIAGNTVSIIRGIAFLAALMLLPFVQFKYEFYAWKGAWPSDVKMK